MMDITLIITLSAAVMLSESADHSASAIPTLSDSGIWLHIQRCVMFDRLLCDVFAHQAKAPCCSMRFCCTAHLGKTPACETRASFGVRLSGSQRQGWHAHHLPTWLAHVQVHQGRL